MVSRSKSVITTIVTPEDDDEHTLEMRYQDDVLEFYVDGKKRFSGDWIGNFRAVFWDAIDYFPEPDKTVTKK